MNTLDKIIEETIQIVLNEQESEKEVSDPKKSSKIFAGGAFGGGSWPSDINAYESRAAKDPKTLVKDLGVNSSKGDDDLQICYNFLSQAINNNKIMSSVFESPQFETIQIDDNDVKICTIKTKYKEFPYRLAAKYICLSLIAGEKSGIFTLDKGVKFLSKNLIEYPSFYKK